MVYFLAFNGLGTRTSVRTVIHRESDCYSAIGPPNPDNTACFQTVNSISGLAILPIASILQKNK